jgi:hypothetical protein
MPGRNPDTNLKSSTPGCGGGVEEVGAGEGT